LKQLNIADRDEVLSDLRFSKLSQLKLVGLVVFSLVAAIVIYAVDVFLTQTILKLSLSKSDLLFLEGLVLVLFGSFVLATGEHRAPSLGLKQRILYGAPVTGMRTVFPSDVIRLSLSIIVAGLILIILSLLGV
jgi:hypothetical protein